MSIGHRAETQGLIEFEYGSLDTETRIVVQQKTSEIKDRIKRSAQDLIEIGERLIDIKARLGHGRFLYWLHAEFDWSERTARSLMCVADTFKSANFADLSLAPSAMYALAAPSVPEPARREAIALAESGHNVTHAEARRIIADHKPAPPPAFTPPIPQPRAAEPIGMPAPRPWIDPDGDDDGDGEESNPPPAVLPAASPRPPVHLGPGPKLATATTPAPDASEDRPVRLVPRDEAEADRWAAQWNSYVSRLLEFMESLPRRGGIVQLTRPWPSSRREQAKEILRDLQEVVAQSLRELEEAS